MPRRHNKGAIAPTTPLPDDSFVLQDVDTVEKVRRLRSTVAFYADPKHWGRLATLESRGPVIPSVRVDTSFGPDVWALTQHGYDIAEGTDGATRGVEDEVRRACEVTERVPELLAAVRAFTTYYIGLSTALRRAAGEYPAFGDRLYQLLDPLEKETQVKLGDDCDLLALAFHVGRALGFAESPDVPSWDLTQAIAHLKGG